MENDSFRYRSKWELQKCLPHAHSWLVACTPRWPGLWLSPTTIQVQQASTQIQLTMVNISCRARDWASLSRKRSPPTAVATVKECGSDDPCWPHHWGYIPIPDSSAATLPGKHFADTYSACRKLWRCALSHSDRAVLLSFSLRHAETPQVICLEVVGEKNNLPKMTTFLFKKK